MARHLLATLRRGAKPNQIESKPNHARPNQNQGINLVFPCISFGESGLFNALRATPLKKLLSSPFSTPSARLAEAFEFGDPEKVARFPIFTNKMTAPIAFSVPPSLFDHAFADFVVTAGHLRVDPGHDPISRIGG